MTAEQSLGFFFKIFQFIYFFRRVAKNSLFLFDFSLLFLWLIILEEGKRMFQMFAAKMFEQRILTAYREKVALEKQKQLIEEEEEKKRNQNNKKRNKREKQKTKQVSFFYF